VPLIGQAGGSLAKAIPSLSLAAAYSIIFTAQPIKMQRFETDSYQTESFNYQADASSPA
jgi:hypothetical protein